MAFEYLGRIIAYFDSAISFQKKCVLQNAYGSAADTRRLKSFPAAHIPSRQWRGIALWYNEANEKRDVGITLSDWNAMIDGSRTQRTL